jgi:hypothetical protein
MQIWYVLHNKHQFKANGSIFVCEKSYIFFKILCEDRLFYEEFGNVDNIFGLEYGNKHMS